MVNNMDFVGGPQFDVYAPQTNTSVSSYIFNADEDIMASIYHFLMGEMPIVKSDGSKEILIWKKLKKPLMTEQGIRFILDVIRGHLNNVSMVSTQDKKLIVARYLEFIHWFNDILVLQYDEYFLTDDSKHFASARNEVFRVVSDIIYYMLFAIHEGRIFKGVTTTTQEVHQYSHEDEGGAVFFKKK